MNPAGGGHGRDRRVIVGKVSGIYGVAGWIKVVSYTRPRENLFDYPRWLLGGNGGWQDRVLVEGRRQGKGLVAKLEGVDDRDAARACMGSDIAIQREHMPALPEGEFYWCDLIGLEVRNRSGVELGKVTKLLETGANDVLEVSGSRRHLIPMVQGRYVLEVDLAGGRITVDWEPGD